MAPFKDLEGKLINKEQGNHCTLENNELDFIGLYFSAQWCPPCKAFTSRLADYYNKVKDEGKKIEIIFVSLDRDEKSFKEYFETMPWMALQFEAERESLAKEYGVHGLPHLVILDNEGKTLTKDGRTLVNEGKDLSL